MIGLFDLTPRQETLFGSTERFRFVDGNIKDQEFFLDSFEFP